MVFMKIFKYIKKNGVKTFIGEIKIRLYLFFYKYKVIRFLIKPLVKNKVPDKWLIILGCYNSGTTLLRELLSFHSEISTLPREGVVITRLLPRPEDKGWKRMWVKCLHYIDNQKDIDPREVMSDWEPWWDSKKVIFLEKSISNLTRIDWFEKNFPNCYFVGITRDGYAVAEGIRRRVSPCSY